LFALNTFLKTKTVHQYQFLHCKIIIFRITLFFVDMN